MKRILLFAAILCFSFNAFAVSLDYFLGDNVKLNPDIPSPQEYFHHEFGAWHINHDQLLAYIRAVDKVSDRIEIETYGSTHLNRELLVLKITAPHNFGKLEAMRKEHLELSDPNKNLDVGENTPFVYWLGYGVHGDEQSASNAAVLMTYYLAACESEELTKILDNSVILLEPCMNPDGFQRNAMWSNMHRSAVPQPDLNNIRFNEMWPTGRYNHYWFDLNRDWLPLEQPESKARIELYQKWKPNLLSDHHEMGTSGTFFFQPGVPTRNNHLTPKKNIDLTNELAAHHGKALEDIGSLYFTEEKFDDFYYGKGSSYPDANGSIGILFEMVKNRGEVIRNENGLVHFSLGIKNHFVASLSMLNAGYKKRKELLEYQQWFYQQASVEAEKDMVKAVVLDGSESPVKMYNFLSLLNSHRIKVYQTDRPVNVKGKTVPASEAYVVPFAQAQYRLLKSIFEINKQFADSVFYDVSSWNLAMAYNFPYEEVKSIKELDAMRGDLVEVIDFPGGEVVGGQSEIGFVIPSSDNNSHKLVYDLLEKDVRLKVASMPFTIQTEGGNKAFSYGDVFVSVAYQNYDSKELYSVLSEMAVVYGVNIYSVSFGLTPEGIDMGSRSLVKIEKPKVLMLIGRGMKISSSGEIRHLLDFKNHIPVTMFESHYFSKIKLFEYTTLILPEGDIDLSSKDAERIKHWVEEGGIVIGMKSANKWLESNDIISIKTKAYPKADASRTYAYADRANESRSWSIGGSIFMSNIDLSHPLCYGYRDNQLPIFKNSRYVPDYTSAYNAPLKLENNPLLSGYIKSENEAFLANSPQIAITKKGRGRVVSFYFNPNFRSFWRGTEKLFMNAVFYGNTIK